jgi:hypothetical protein
MRAPGSPPVGRPGWTTSASGKRPDGLSAVPRHDVGGRDEPTGPNSNAPGCRNARPMKVKGSSGCLRWQGCSECRGAKGFISFVGPGPERPGAGRHVFAGISGEPGSDRLVGVVVSG